MSWKSHKVLSINFQSTFDRHRIKKSEGAQKVRIFYSKIIFLRYSTHIKSWLLLLVLIVYLIDLRSIKVEFMLKRRREVSGRHKNFHDVIHAQKSISVLFLSVDDIILKLSGSHEDFLLINFFFSSLGFFPTALWSFMSHSQKKFWQVQWLNSSTKRTLVLCLNLRQIASHSALFSFISTINIGF